MFPFQFTGCRRLLRLRRRPIPTHAHFQLSTSIPIVPPFSAILPNPAPRALTVTLISPLFQFLHPPATPVSPLRPPKPGRPISVSPLLRLCAPAINYNLPVSQPTESYRMQSLLRRGWCGNRHLHPFLLLHVAISELVKWARGGLELGFLV